MSFSAAPKHASPGPIFPSQINVACERRGAGLGACAPAGSGRFSDAVGGGVGGVGVGC